MGEDGLKEKGRQKHLKRMHNICPTLAPSPTVTALSKEISLDYGRADIVIPKYFNLQFHL